MCKRTKRLNWIPNRNQVARRKRENNLAFSKCLTFIWKKKKKKLSHLTINMFTDRYGTLSAGIICCTHFHILAGTLSHTRTHTQGARWVMRHMFSSRRGFKTVRKKAVSTTDCNTVNTEKEIRRCR